MNALGDASPSFGTRGVNELAEDNHDERTMNADTIHDSLGAMEQSRTQTDTEHIRMELRETLEKLKEAQNEAQAQGNQIQALAVKNMNLRQKNEAMKKLNKSLSPRMVIRTKQRDKALESLARMGQLINAKVNKMTDDINAEATAVFAAAEESDLDCEKEQADVERLTREADDLREDNHQLTARLADVENDLLSCNIEKGVSIRQIVRAAEVLKPGDGVTLDLTEFGEEAVTRFKDHLNSHGVVQSQKEDWSMITTKIEEAVLTVLREKDKEFWFLQHGQFVHVTTKHVRFSIEGMQVMFSLQVPGDIRFKFIGTRSTQRAIDQYLSKFYEDAIMEQWVLKIRQIRGK